ncbi:hypothetical protein [Corynebacterium anserum]|uniref:Uncharacterized protein n=1 Tax=Corynebacterium anserum TaxID=2684406 RepID=A0A7G7YNL6_9CORY|nr:hypothetical protein [Corynebacterium anserum]QNH96086.1 hypothetical protein GP473_04890 [Corynebacterium anserum]
MTPTLVTISFRSLAPNLTPNSTAAVLAVPVLFGAWSIALDFPYQSWIVIGNPALFCASLAYFDEKE